MDGGYVLILMLMTFTPDHRLLGQNSVSGDFNTEAACKAALEKLVNEAEHSKEFGPLEVRMKGCFPKG